MSLTVPADLLEQARHGEVDDAEFLDCVRTSLPYAWNVIGDLITELGAGDADFVLSGLKDHCELVIGDEAQPDLFLVEDAGGITVARGDESHDFAESGHGDRPFGVRSPLLYTLLRDLTLRCRLTGASTR